MCQPVILTVGLPCCSPPDCCFQFIAQPTCSSHGAPCVQVGENERPMHPPTIKGSEVLWNPFEDIVPRTTREERAAEATAARCGTSGQG